MNKYVNVSFRYDNVLMYHIVHKFVMPEAHSFFLSDWQTSLNYSVISWCMYIHQSTSINGLHNSISNWSMMICVGWLYVYLIVCNDGEWRDTSLIIFTLFNVWLFQLFTENKLCFNPRNCNGLAHFGMINNRNKLLDTGIYNPGKMDNLNLQMYITCFLVHLCISNMTYLLN